MLKTYLLLTKPGIIMGNLIAASSGFFLASQGTIHLASLLGMCLGTTLVIASGCVLNNIVDRDIDNKMQRTRNRALVVGKISVDAALWYGLSLGILGFYTLIVTTNWVATFFAGLGFVVYVGFYTLWSKRSSVHGTLIGSLSGACPPVIGYVSVTNQFDTAAAIILLTFSLWQMPHSYAIAIYRFDDYFAANIPVLPVKKGTPNARKQMIAYIIAFAIVALGLSVFGYVGYWYALIIGGSSLYWLYLTVTGYPTDDEKGWARRVFIVSIVIIMAFSVMVSIDFIKQPSLSS